MFQGILLTTINNYFSKPSGLMNAVRLQERLETIEIPGLEHGERYRQLCMKLVLDVTTIMEQFQTKYTSPPLERNMPHFSGRISWARNLYRRLEEPMNVICIKASKALLSPEGQELVSAYNDATTQLVSYEITVYQTWSKLVRVKKGRRRCRTLILKIENRLLSNI